jgi:hypothetical protein
MTHQPGMGSLIDSAKAIVGLHPSFSAHVRPTASRGGWGERGAPVRFPLDAVIVQTPTGNLAWGDLGEENLRNKTEPRDVVLSATLPRAVSGRNCLRPFFFATIDPGLHQWPVSDTVISWS